MTREETIKILSILKAAYPNSYKNMTKEEANGTVAVWTTQFADMPAEIVLHIINDCISESPFPPAISEVKHRIDSMCLQAKFMLSEQRTIPYLSDESVNRLKQIIEVIESANQKKQFDLSIVGLISGDKKLLD